MKSLKLTLFFSLFFLHTIIGQDTAALKSFLPGKWEVVKYAEQGVQVDKKLSAATQAQKVYEHIFRQRARDYYFYDEYSGERRTRAFERWIEEDRNRETNRLTEAIAMPYFAVFFADSTLSVYNKDTSGIYFPEARHFTFAPATMSMDISYPGGAGIQWQAQILVLTRERMVLFLPEDAETVELVKVDDSLP